MGLSGLEPPTSRLSGVRSNRLSYKPLYFYKGRLFPFPLSFCPRTLWRFPYSFFNSGGHLLSRVPAVSSASRGLTFVFGMGTGGSPGRIATGISFFVVVLSPCIFYPGFAPPRADIRHTHPALNNQTAIQPLLLPLERR